MGAELHKSSDSEIIQVILNGNKEAFGILVERYSPMFYGFAFNCCRDYDTAADLVQQGLIAAYNNLDRLRDPSSFSSWVAGIIKNKYRNLGRKKTVPTVPLDDLIEKGFEPPDSDTQSPIKKEELQRIRHYISQLPEKYREVILLRYVEDFSYKKIADILNQTISTITMRLMYARRMLVEKARKDGLV